MSACTRSLFSKRSALALLLAASLPALGQQATDTSLIEQQLEIKLKNFRSDLLAAMAAARRNGAPSADCALDVALAPRRNLSTYFFLLNDQIAEEAVKNFIPLRTTRPSTGS
jgi:hypothetical protein